MENFVLRNGSDAILKDLEKNVRNRFRWNWLEEKDISGVFLSDYVKKLREPGIAWCEVWCDCIKYGSGGKEILHQHSKSVSHKKKMELQKSYQQLPAVFQASKDLESDLAVQSTSKLRYGCPPNVQIGDLSREPEAPPPPRPVSMKDRISHQEALICTFIAENTLPLSLAPKLIELSQELARDAKALQSLSMERTSCTYKLKDDVAAVQHKRLVQAIKDTAFSLNIDESTSKANKKRILNILVCYFSIEQQNSVTHLYHAVEMTTVNAETVFNAVMSKFREDGIPLGNLISILSDSAAYMR